MTHGSKPLKTVTLEILRPGSWHGRPLGPDVRYITLCNDSEPVEISFAMEQVDFDHKLARLQYATHEDDHTAQTLRELGNAVGRMLQGTGLMNELNIVDKLVEVKIVTSGAEVIKLPFELCRSQLPSGDGDYVFARGARNLLLTRSVRRKVWPSEFSWPANAKVLVISGDVNPDLLKQHVAAIQDATSVERVVQIPRASLSEIRRVCAIDTYSHVHFVAHGRLAKNNGDRIGVELFDDKTGAVQVYSAKLLLDALSGDEAPLPSMIMLATCASAAQGSVLSPGGSLAYEFHVEGVPFVVAAQFPLTHEGSVVLASTFYEHHLKLNADPRLAVSVARRELHTKDSLPEARSHDWASVTVYSRLPPDRLVSASSEDARIERARTLLSSVSPKTSPEALLGALLDILDGTWKEWPNPDDLKATLESAFQEPRIYAIDHFNPRIWGAGDAYYWLAIQARDFAKANYDRDANQWRIHFSPRVHQAINEALARAAAIFPGRPAQAGHSYASWDDKENRIDWSQPRPIRRLEEGEQRDSRRYGKELVRILIWRPEFLSKQFAKFVVDFHDTFRIPLFFLTPDAARAQNCGLEWEYLFGCGDDEVDRVANLPSLGGAPWDREQPLKGRWREFSRKPQAYDPLDHFHRLLRSPQLLLAKDAIEMNQDHWRSFLQQCASTSGG